MEFLVFMRQMATILWSQDITSSVSYLYFLKLIQTHPRMPQWLSLYIRIFGILMLHQNLSISWGDIYIMPSMWQITWEEEEWKLTPSVKGLENNLKQQTTLYFNAGWAKKCGSLRLFIPPPGDILNHQTYNENLELLLSLNRARNKEVSLELFIGWRIWKSMNNLVFNNRKWLIPDIINKALVELNIWKEAELLKRVHDNHMPIVYDKRQQYNQAQTITLSTVLMTIAAL